MAVQVTTNGWFIDAEKAAALYAAGVYQVNVSVDSADPAVHDRGRRKEGAHARALRALELLRDAPKIAADQRVCIESILSGRNDQQAEAMIGLAERLGVNLVFQPFSAGHVGEIEDMGAVGADVSARLLALKRRHRCLQNSEAMIKELSGFFQSGAVPGCMAGRSIFNVDSTGAVTRCEEQRRSYGDVRALDAAGLLAALEAIQRDTLADGCSSCYLRTRGETEPLYQDNLEQLLRATRDMFDVQLPRVIPRLAGLPGARSLVRLGVRGLARLHAVQTRI
jgi:MoaA/NifB/PqqE/SkfB family radical SAM enzyme